MGEERNQTGAIPPKNARRKKALMLLGIAAVVTIGSGAFYWWYRQTHIATDDAFVEGRIHPVSARIQGTIVEVLVEDNQPVKRGQPLLRIDPEPYAVRVSAASSALSAATADLSAARSDIAAAEADIQAARQDLAAAQAQLDQARLAVEAARSRVVLTDAQLTQAGRDAERAGNLFERQSISRERHEKTQTELSVSRARNDLAREELRLAEAAIPTFEALISQRKAVLAQRQASFAQRKAKVGQQGAVVRQRESALDEAKLYRNYADVVAPADGYVTRKGVEVGQVVSPGQPLLAVADLSDVWVQANYKETQIERIHPGQEVVIRIDTFAGKKFRGKVESIMAGTGSAFSLFPPENATGNYVKVVQRVPVKIVLDRGEDPEHVLRIGMSVVPTVLVR
ncbi:MAG TPA: HlyD family secretion protein [Candidatus Deferrimicrobiaceae bacterium]|nr:HlyD family secretion protein [Candidatus Deferrimicrobiaceae bacterium]